MRNRRRRHNSVTPLRRGFVATAVLAYVAAAVGVPLPVGGGKDRSIAFPCMDRPCGCHDAGGCKEHCCCFTSEQKLAWAAEHHVDPAPFVNFAVLAPGRPAGGATSTEQGAACCASGSHQLDAKKGSGFRVQGSGNATDAHHPEAPASHHEEFASDSFLVGSGIESWRPDANDVLLASSAAPPERTDDDSISIAAYRACHGLGPLWSMLGAALPPPQPLGYEFLWDLGESVAPVPVAAVAFSLSPPTPPPRG